MYLFLKSKAGNVYFAVKDELASKHGHKWKKDRKSEWKRQKEAGRPGKSIEIHKK